MDTADHTRPIKSYEWVMNDLKRQLEDGSLTAGDRLPSVVKLAEQYQVGRSTIREALSALKAMGLIDIRQGGGTFVKERPDAGSEQPMHPSLIQPEAWLSRAETLRHILDVRRIMETGCAKFAARNRTEEDLRRLSDTLADMEQHLHDEASSEQADVRFHKQIAIATHNPLLVDMIESLSHNLHETMKDTRALWFYAERSSAERLLREHQAIYEAIVQRDAEEAAARMDKHIAKVEQVLHERKA